MEVTYKKNFNQSYMIIEPEYDSEEIYELKILANNRIAGLLPVEMSIADGIPRYWYDITGKQSLSDFLERKGADSEILRILFCCLEDICIELEKFMLEEQRVILKEDYIYLTFESCKIYVAYLPGKQGNLMSEFQELMERLLQRLNHGDKEAVAMGYEMYQLCLQTELAFTQMFKSALCKGKEPEEEKQKNWESPENIPEREQESEQMVCVQEEEPPKGEQKLKRNVLGHKFSELVHKLSKWNLKVPWKKETNTYVPYVTEEEEPMEHPTEYLGNHGKDAGKLIYQGQGDYSDIYLDKEIFIIGKSIREVDGYIEQKSVSRIHAKIEKENNHYYIEDLNSTNGTFLNGQQLEYKQKIKLKSRDHIVFGIVEFIFM